MKYVYSLGLTLVIGLGIVMTFGYLSCSEQHMQDQPESSQAPEFVAQPSESHQSSESMKSEETVRINWNQVDLSVTQKEHLARKQWDFQREVAGLQQHLMRVQQDLAATIWQYPVDRQKIDTSLNNMTSLQHQISKAALQNLLEITNLLSQEQREMLALANSHRNSMLCTLIRSNTHRFMIF